jgi:hypothetical protein
MSVNRQGPDISGEPEEADGTELREYAVRISRERWALRQEIRDSGFRSAGDGRLE